MPQSKRATPLSPAALRKQLYVTLREIEHAVPCHGGYAQGLRMLRSNPIAGCYRNLAHYPKPRYTADDPIPLHLFQKIGRVDWLRRNIPRLNRLAAVQAKPAIAKAQKQLIAVRKQIRAVEKQLVGLRYQEYKLEHARYDQPEAIFLSAVKASKPARVRS